MQLFMIVIYAKNLKTVNHFPLNVLIHFVISLVIIVVKIFIQVNLILNVRLNVGQKNILIGNFVE